MRQLHKADEKLFVDYCGHNIPIVNTDTGECYNAQIFVAAQAGTCHLLRVFLLIYSASVLRSAHRA